MENIPKTIANVQGRSLAFSSTVGRDYGERGNIGEVVYSGNVSIDVNGQIINSVGLRPATGAYFSQTGRTLVGVNDFVLPQTDGDVTLKFNVMYTFSDGTGHIPSRRFEHKLQIGFTKP